MPNPSELTRELTEDAHRRHAIAKGYATNLAASKGTRELALRQMRALEADYPELAGPEPVAKGDEDRELHLLLVDIRHEITRVNQAAGYMVFNPTITRMVQARLDS